MEEATTIISKDAPAPANPLKKPTGHESHFFGVTLRGLITLMVVGTCCYMSVGGLEIKEPFYTLVGMVVAYYFGQNAKSIKPTDTK